MVAPVSPPHRQQPVNNNAQQHVPNPDYYNNNSVPSNNHGHLHTQRRAQESAVEQLQRSAPNYRANSNAISGSAYPSGGSQIINNNPEMHRSTAGYDPYENYARPTATAQMVPNQQYATGPQVVHPQQSNNNYAAGYNQAGLGYDPVAMAYAGGMVGQQPPNNNYGYNNSHSANNNNGKPVVMQQQHQQQAQHEQHQMGAPGQFYMNHNNNFDAGANIGKIADYDPLTDGPRKNLPNVSRPSSTLVYSSGKLVDETILITLSVGEGWEWDYKLGSGNRN